MSPPPRRVPEAADEPSTGTGTDTDTGDAGHDPGDEPGGNDADEAAGDEPAAGAGIVNASWVGTGVFVATASAAAATPDVLGDVAAAVALVLFALGCGAFLWAYGLAVSRSRTDAIGIGGLFFLHGSAPSAVRLRLLLALTVDVVAAVVTAAIRPYTSLAFGILVPMYGLSLAGLWGAKHGTFPPRRARGARGAKGEEQP